MRIISKVGVAGFVVCSLSVALLAQEKGHQLSATEREHILDGQFKLVSTTEGIPANIKQAFSQVSRQSSFAMANPGQKYQVGDVVVDRNLPFRRLVFAGGSNDKGFIHYERGGRGHGYYLVVFKVDPDGDAHFLWGGSGLNGARNLEQLRKMIADGRFSDKQNYYW